jgi:hypothetical protein
MPVSASETQDMLESPIWEVAKAVKDIDGMISVTIRLAILGAQISKPFFLAF